MREVKKNVIFKRKTGEIQRKTGYDFAENRLRASGNLYTLQRKTGYGAEGKGSPAHVTEDMGESGQRSGTYIQKVSGLTLRLKKAKLT